MLGGEIVLFALLLVATITDLLWGKIPNILTFPLMLLGLIYSTYTAGFAGAGQCLLAIGVAFIMFFPLYLIHTFAAGDVKLLMAFGAWAGPDLVIRVGIFSILIGAVVGTFLMLKKSGWKGSAKSLRKHLRIQRMETNQSYRMPLAPAFLCAMFLVQIVEVYHWTL